MSLLHKGRVLECVESELFGMPTFDINVASQKEDAPSLQQTAEMMEKAAYEEGFAAGESAGMKLGKQKATLLADKFEKILQEFSEFAQGLPDKIEAQVFELSVAIARRIVKDELRLDQRLITMMVRDALERVVKTGPVTVKASPAIKELLEGIRPELLELHPEINFDFTSSVGDLGAHVIGPEEVIIADIDFQIDNIAEEIRRKIDEHKS